MNLDKIIKNIYYIKFSELFGNLFYMASDGTVCYEYKTELYVIPETMTEEQILEICKKSVIENKDYLLAYLKKNNKKVSINTNEEVF